MNGGGEVVIRKLRPGEGAHAAKIWRDVADEIKKDIQKVHAKIILISVELISAVIALSVFIYLLFSASIKLKYTGIS